MSTQCEVTVKKAVGSPMGFFERYLTAWVFLCIIAGITLGHFIPGPFQLIGRMEVAKVNMPVAVLIWLMIIPMLLKIDFAALHHVREHWRGVGVTLFVNWAVKPFSMALLAWLFIRNLFAGWLPADPGWSRTETFCAWPTTSCRQAPMASPLAVTSGRATTWRALSAP